MNVHHTLHNGNWNLEIILTIKNSEKEEIDKQQDAKGNWAAGIIHNVNGSANI